MALVIVGACGDPDPPTNGDPALACVPHLPAGWVPQWKPPNPPDADACTAAQIGDSYQLCDSPSATLASCRTFGTDPANARCSHCLNSSEVDPSYGPIVRLKNGSWRTNTAGCVALVDGSPSDGGCGARVHAATSCYDAACSKCEPFASYVKCLQQASETVCRSYYLDAVCTYRPAYATCVEWATSAEYYVAMVTIFCRNARPANAVDPTENAN